MKNRHFAHFQIAGFTYWEGAVIFNELKIGTKLSLVQEIDNKFDAYAVAIYYKDYKLGFVPRGENQEINKFLEQGYTDMFEVVINRVTPDVDPEGQIGVVVFLKPNKR